MAKTKRKTSWREIPGRIAEMYLEGLRADAERHKAASVTPVDTAVAGSNWLPGGGIADAAGAYPNQPSLWENLKLGASGNWPSFVYAGLQGLDAGGDFLAAAAPLIGVPVATGIPPAGQAARFLGVSQAPIADLPPVQFPPPAAPPTLKRAHNVAKLGRIPGAPPHVTDATGEAQALEHYLGLVLYGAPAGAWYDDESARMLAMAGNRPGVADRVAGGFGVISANNSLPGNAVGGARGWNQAAMGAPVNTQTGANDRKFEQIFQGMVARLGPKIDPYIGHLRTRWNTGAARNRSVHDVWDMRAWSYPERMKSAGTAQHRWMDKMTVEAVAEANRRALGGKTDWNEKSLQAAAWTALKAEELGVSAADLAHGYKPYLDNLVARLHVESQPSAEIENPLTGMSEAERARYHRGQEAIMTTPEGYDVPSQALYALETPEGKTFGPGQWGNERNEVTTFGVYAGPQQGTKGQPLERSSRALTEAIAAIHGLLRGQADVGYEYLRPAPTRALTNSFVLDFGRPVDVSDLNRTQAELDARFGQYTVGLAPTADGNGLVLSVYKPRKVPGEKLVEQLEPVRKRSRFVGPMREPEGPVRQDREVSIGGQAVVLSEGKHNSGKLVVGRDDWAYRPSEYLKKLGNPLVRQRVKAIMPALAADMQDLMKSTGGKWGDVYTKTLEALQTGGLEEVERLVKKGVLPAAVVAILAERMHDQEVALSEDGA